MQSHIPPLQRRPVGATRALWSALDAAATPISTLVILVALVRALSASDYGILVIAFAASGLSMAVNPAIAATTTKFVSELSGPSHPGGRTAAGVVTVSLMVVIVFDLVLLFGTMLFIEPLIRWMFGAAARDQHLNLVFLLAVLAIGIQQVESVVAAAIRGCERFRRQALIELVSRVALTMTVVYVAWRTRSLIAILDAQCLVYLASTLVRAVALRQVLPDKRLFDLSGWANADSLFKYGGWMWLTALAGAAYTGADRIIIGRSLGPAAAGQYNIYIQITQLIHFIPSSVFAFSFPVFSRLAARGNGSDIGIAKAYQSYLLSAGGLALGIAATMTVSWPILLSILAGPGFNEGKFGAPSLLALNFVLLACNVTPYYLLLALGQAKTVAVVTTISMLVALVLMALLIPRYGLVGAALARLAYGAGALTLLLKARRLLKT